MRACRDHRHRPGHRAWGWVRTETWQGLIEGRSASARSRLFDPRPCRRGSARRSMDFEPGAVRRQSPQAADDDPQRPAGARRRDAGRARRRHRIASARRCRDARACSSAATRRSRTRCTSRKGPWSRANEDRDRRHSPVGRGSLLRLLPALLRRRDSRPPRCSTSRSVRAEGREYLLRRDRRVGPVRDRSRLPRDPARRGRRRRRRRLRRRQLVVER